MGSPESELCRACGFCCDGTLFGGVQLAEGEVPSAGRRLPIHRDADGASVRFPCPAHDGACTIYDDRPETCRSYRCDLFAGVASGEADLERSIARVESVREQLGRVRAALGVERADLWRAIDALGDRPLAWRLEHGDLLLDVVRLREVLTRFFDARTARRPR